MCRMSVKTRMERIVGSNRKKGNVEDFEDIQGFEGDIDVGIW